jgi:hypothetical protein
MFHVGRGPIGNTLFFMLAADCFGLEHFGAILGLVFTAYGFV